MIYFVDDVGPSPLAQNVPLHDLPLRDVGQHPHCLFSRQFTLSSAHIQQLMKSVDQYVAYMQVLFVSEKMVIGVGFDCSPMVFAADERGIW